VKTTQQYFESSTPSTYARRYAVNVSSQLIFIKFLHIRNFRVVELLIGKQLWN